MSRFILDVSANTHRNDWEYLKKMLDNLKAIDTGKHEIIIKHQLFVKAGENIPLDREIFKVAYNYASNLGYKTTSSVFDKESLDFLLQFNIPFVKIANNRNLDWLISEIPYHIPVYLSVGNKKEWHEKKDADNIVTLCCVSDYSNADIKDYEKFHPHLARGCKLSDHTHNWDLFNKYRPEIYECHYCLEHDENNLDGGLFSRTIEQLKEIL
jgi:sialic acid synthase SpsE